MSELEWLNLKVGDYVNSLTRIGCSGMQVEEIVEDDRSLNIWSQKGYTNVKRLIKFSKENTVYHTWSVEPEKWSK